ncbi:MAG TPA: TetR family transcriptional regulator [Planctomycetota bacterium]|nr:TetR family transcriptional regulator [Planctomycetota bacterium]
MARKVRPGLRELLLDAAIRDFAEHGYHPVSLDLVAARCDVTKGAVYLHFRNKLELFLEAHQRLESKRDARMRRGEDGGALQQLEAFLFDHLSFHREHPQLRRLQAILDTEVAGEPSASGRDGLRATYRALRARLRGLLLRAVRDNEIGPVDAAGLAFSLAALVEGVLAQAASSAEDVALFFDERSLIAGWIEQLPKAGRRRRSSAPESGDDEEFRPAF